MLGFICSVRSSSDVHGGHCPQRARKRQTECRDDVAAAGSGGRQHMLQHTLPSFSYVLHPSRPFAHEHSQDLPDLPMSRARTRAGAAGAERLSVCYRGRPITPSRLQLGWPRGVLSVHNSGRRRGRGPEVLQRRRGPAPAHVAPRHTSAQITPTRFLLVSLLDTALLAGAQASACARAPSHFGYM